MEVKENLYPRLPTAPPIDDQGQGYRLQKINEIQAFLEKEVTTREIVVSGNESSFNTMFSPNIELAKDRVYEIALVNLETYYSFPNIDETNNIFVYSPDNGNSWVKIKIPECE